MTRLYSLSLLQFLSLILLFTLFFLSASDTSELFEKWCKEHSKTYSSEEEKLYRLKVFEDNYAFVAQHNQNANNNNNNSSYTLSLNAFADLTHHEFKTTRLGLPLTLLRFKRPQNQQSRDLLHIPSQIDWRQSGAVTPVKDQASCGTTFLLFTPFFLIILLPWFLKIPHRLMKWFKNSVSKWEIASTNFWNWARSNLKIKMVCKFILMVAFSRFGSLVMEPPGVMQSCTFDSQDA